MALGKEIGDFSFEITSTSYAGDAGTVHVNVAGLGEGAWEEVGKHRWRTRMVVRMSDGQVFASDGLLDLATRSLKGKNLEWSCSRRPADAASAMPSRADRGRGTRERRAASRARVETIP